MMFCILYTTYVHVLHVFASSYINDIHCNVSILTFQTWYITCSYIHEHGNVVCVLFKVRFIRYTRSNYHFCFLLACSYIDHGSYKKGSKSYLLYIRSGTLEFCKTECSSNPSCKGFGRRFGSCYFSSSSEPIPTTSCSDCFYYTKDNCGSYRNINLSIFHDY